MSYRMAGIDVHKKMLAVVVSDVEIDGQYQFERRSFGIDRPYWRPVWEAVERYWKPIREKRKDARSFMASLFAIGRHVRRHAPRQEFTE